MERNEGGNSNKVKALTITTILKTHDQCDSIEAIAMNGNDVQWPENHYVALTLEIQRHVWCLTLA